MIGKLLLLHGYKAYIKPVIRFNVISSYLPTLVPTTRIRSLFKFDGLRCIMLKANDSYIKVFIVRFLLL